MDFLALLRRVHARPAMYLRRSSLTHLAHFILGYKYGRGGGRAPYPLDGFREFVHEHYKQEMNSKDAEHLILENSPTENDGFFTYFELLDLFMKKRGQSFFGHDYDIELERSTNKPEDVEISNWLCDATKFVSENESLLLDAIAEIQRHSDKKPLNSGLLERIIELGVMHISVDAFSTTFTLGDIGPTPNTMCFGFYFANDHDPVFAIDEIRVELTQRGNSWVWRDPLSSNIFRTKRISGGFFYFQRL